jgi:hypothetical protein
MALIFVARLAGKYPERRPTTTDIASPKIGRYIGIIE